jgi:hypothetical protein
MALLVNKSGAVNALVAEDQGRSFPFVPPKTLPSESLSVICSLFS